ncbi:MAG: nucleoside deaminase [Saccharofermentanales bacterium]
MVERTKSPSFYMEKALQQARTAAGSGETPVGAVIVKDDKIIARGYNMREKSQDVTHHAEMAAIRKACRKLDSWRLDGCDIYVTLEPCIMCAGAILQAKIRKVYFGAAEPKGGAVISKTNIFDLPLNHVVEYEGGILQKESADLLTSFFVQMREKDRQTGLTKGQRRNFNKSDCR